MAIDLEIWNGQTKGLFHDLDGENAVSTSRVRNRPATYLLYPPRHLFPQLEVIRPSWLIQLLIDQPIHHALQVLSDADPVLLLLDDDTIRLLGFHAGRELVASSPRRYNAGAR